MLHFVAQDTPLESIQVYQAQCLLLAYYRILQANRELPGLLIWPLSHLSTLIWMSGLDNGVRLLAIRCYALQSGMGESEREALEAEALGEVECPLHYSHEIDGTSRQVDAWVLPVHEVQRIRATREDLLVTKFDYFSTDDGGLAEPIEPRDMR